MTVKMGYPGKLLNCGIFEIDEIEFDTPPDTFTIKAIAAAITKGLRTRNNKAFEEQTLFSIAQFFADKHGLQVVGSSTELQNIEIERKTQENETDLSFLAGIAKEYGFIFSVRGSQLIFIDVEELEQRPVITSFTREKLSKCNFRDKTSQTYGSAIVSSRNAKENTLTVWEVAISVLISY